MSSIQPEQYDPRTWAVDRHVASRLRLCRQAVGLSQQQLAAQIGTTSQQVQRYEMGVNRLSAGLLHAIADALCTNVAYFFEHLEPVPLKAEDYDHRRRLVELTHIVGCIANPAHRQAICGLARALADQSAQQPAELG